MENAASRFGQRLAHTEKKYRDQALKKLTVYLTKKSDWTDLEWDKLWKALFYCMWMSDKRPVQEELSTNLATLIHKIPTPEIALRFVHSFFRTMHREWHGIDGLRLDKFYSLIRKFVHESIVLLRNNEFDDALVTAFVSMVSSEIVSQLPNGLRMHLSDLFLDETFAAAGTSIDTDAFLLLLEPFFTLLSSEYDKTVFKRVKERVFLPMLSIYKFGDQLPLQNASEKETDNETDGDDGDEDDDKVFELVELAQVQHRLFAIASADDTAERNRSGLYDLYSKFFAVTKIDSLKAAQADATERKKPLKKRTKKKTTEAMEASEAVTATVETVVETPVKKSKKRKNAVIEPEAKATAAVVVAEETIVVEETTGAVVEAPVVERLKKKAKKSKTQKAAEAAAVAEAEATAAAETAAAAAAASALVDAAAAAAKTTTKETSDVVLLDATTSAPVKTKRQEKKARYQLQKQLEQAAAAAAAAATPVEATKATKKVAPASATKTDDKPLAVKAAKAAAPPAAAAKQPLKKFVIKSGIKFQRCSVCNGYGKGLVPANKDACSHCERQQKTQKQAAVANAKKRKASELAAAAAAAESELARAKKVTFGKNKALPHDLSVKRLKASAKKDATMSKDDTSGLKGVLKATAVASVTTVTTSSKKAKTKDGKRRMKAADFF